MTACSTAAPPHAQPTHTPPSTPTTTTTVASVDTAVQHNVDEVNRHRAAAGLAPVVLDETLSAFAQHANADFAASGAPHTVMRANHDQLRVDAGATVVKENQGKRAGRFSGDQQLSATKMITAIIEGMMAEGPGGGHHDTILDPRFKRIGVSVITEGNRVFITNDFAD
jgi:uncharacterized protein YkwD